jgi:hypothetical protein
MQSIFWLEEAIDAALSRLKGHRIDCGPNGRRIMRDALNSAAITQQVIIEGPIKPDAVYSQSGLMVGDWDKDEAGDWQLDMFCYD